MEVHYALLRPEELTRRLADCPVAYLPLGTLEWHGYHLPLGSDGLQAEGLFERLASEVGGVVLPMLFLGPDRRRETESGVLYGMDFCTKDLSAPGGYPDGQLPGSCYWVDDEVFDAMLRAALKQIARAGFRVAVLHGHGPSISWVLDHCEVYEEAFGLLIRTCVEPGQGPDTGFQCDHAAMNETSIMMYMHSNLVDMSALPDGGLLAIAGKDPREFANADLGEGITRRAVNYMRGVIAEALERETEGR